MLREFAMKAVTVIIQLLTHALKAGNEMIDLMNRSIGNPRNQSGVVTSFLVA